MTLILDAYNIVGALDRYRVAESFDQARELLINDTLKVAGWTGREIIVVFDAPRSSEPRRETLLAGGAVRTVYSGPGESADDIIERLLNTVRGEITVYTADFALQRAALARGAVRATPREFADLMDELPAVTHAPTRPRKLRVVDHLTPEALRQLEELRRKLD